MIYNKSAGEAKKNKTTHHPLPKTKTNKAVVKAVIRESVFN